MDAAQDRPGLVPAGAVAVAAACLLGAEGIHTAVIAEHFREWWAEGAFFFVLSLLEGGLAVVLLLAPSRRPCQAAVLLSLATIAVWAWSRTTGLPLGPEAGYPEAVGRADAVATSLEAVTALALAPAVLRPTSGWLRAGRPRITAAAVAVIALTTGFGLAGGDNHAGHIGQAPPAPINVAPAPAHR
jgi:hypothetical protein